MTSNSKKQQERHYNALTASLSLTLTSTYSSLNCGVPFTDVIARASNVGDLATVGPSKGANDDAEVGVSSDPFDFRLPSLIFGTVVDVPPLAIGCAVDCMPTVSLLAYAGRAVPSDTAVSFCTAEKTCRMDAFQLRCWS